MSISVSQVRNSQVHLPPDALPLPSELSIHSIKNWLEYGIWGLVLYDGQTPWFALIECMQMLHSMASERKPLFPGLRRGPSGETQHEHVAYTAPLNYNLRHLLFRDREVMRLRDGASADSARLWDDFTERTKEATSNRVDVSYLQKAFEGDFRTFANALDLLKSAEVESFGSQRWTSRHLLPFGPNMLFADVKDGETPANDRLIFRRTGEILWMMMNRSKEATRTELERLVRLRLIDVHNPWDSLAVRIGSPSSGQSTKGEPVKMSTGYFPMPAMEVYENLARDWIALLSLDRLQMELLLDPLMRLSGLHQLIYVLARCDAEVPGGSHGPIVLDVAGSARKSTIYKLSSDIYENHRKYPLRAAEHYLASYAESAEWQGILGKINRKIDAYGLVNKRFLWPQSKASPNEAKLPEPTEHLEEVLNAYQSSSHTIWSMFANHGRRIGLIVARQRSGTWYVPNDSLLEALVLANVRGPMEISIFLRELCRRYSIVIGPEQARASFGSEAMSLEPFKTNLSRFEERLGVLGCIERKSDACAFVINPYVSEEEAV